MRYEYAFFDVDSLELSKRGVTFTCHPQATSISEKLFEVYGIISAIAAPLMFSIDVKGNVPDDKRQRDFLSIPISETEKEWKKSIPDWRKFYIKREDLYDKEKTSIFNNNKNAVDCVKTINSKEWIVFGNGIEHGVDHVMNTLFGLVHTVKYIPELIVPGETESADLLDSYRKKWEEKGAIPITYNDVFLMAYDHKY